MSQEELDALMGLVNSAGRTEVRCGEFLKYITGCMVKNIDGRRFELIHDSTEFPMHRGRADYIISATKHQPGGPVHNIFLWELKASNCHVFEFDNDHRLRPSDFLYDAEHKLINYYQAIRADEDSRRRFSLPGGSIIGPDNVKMGGIIIGKNTNRIEGLEDARLDEISAQYQIAIDTRNIFYNDRITIYTWDDIIEEFKRVNVVGRSIEAHEILEVRLPPGSQYLKITH